MVASNQSAAAALALGTQYGPNAAVALQRSQYLADALQNLQAQGTANIRTPTAAWANVLSNAVLGYSKNKADKDAMAAFGADRAAQDNGILNGLAPTPDASAPPPPQTPPSPTPAGPTPAPAPVAPQPPMAPPAAPMPTAASGVSPDNRLRLAQMVLGEAGGEPPTGQQAVAAVALNRAKTSGKDLGDILSAPHQFEGYNAKARSQGADNPAIQRILATIDPELSGADPTGGATNFLNPTLQGQLGRPQPSWAPPGQGQRIGNHVFYGGNPQMAQAGGPQAPPQNISQPGPVQDQPYQVASNGPTPPPPMASLGQQASQGSSPPPALAPPPAAVSPGLQAGGVLPQQTPQGPQAIPHGPAPQPQEIALVKQLLSDPRTHAEGVALGLKLRERMATPAALKPGTYYAPDGAVKSFEQFQDQPGSPNAIVQRSSLDGHVSATANPAYGSLPSGSHMDAQGNISQAPVQARPTFKIPGLDGQYALDEKGMPQKVGPSAYGPEQLISMRNTLEASEPVKKFREASAAWGAMQNAASQGLGGMRAYALRDTFARLINPGAVARVGTIQAIEQAQGLPANIRAFLMNLKGDGNVPPEIAQQILDVSQGFLAAHYKEASGLNQTNADFAKRHGIDPSDITSDLGAAPQPFHLPTQQAQPQQPAQQPQMSAVQAEIARRKAAGVWKGN